MKIVLHFPKANYPPFIFSIDSFDISPTLHNTVSAEFALYVVIQVHPYCNIRNCPYVSIV